MDESLHFGIFFFSFIFQREELFVCGFFFSFYYRLLRENTTTPDCWIKNKKKITFK